MPRLRTLAILVGAPLAAIAVFRHARGPVSHDAPGGIVMADAERYDSLSGVFLRSFYASVAADVVAGAPAGARVLDVGCGPGHLANLLAGRGFDVTGLDLDPAMVQRARANAEHVVRAERRPDFVAGSVDALPFPAASFDLVVSTLSLHHWEDATAGQAEIARVLRPGGRAIIWDIRPGVVPLHGHAPDPLEKVGGSALRIASVAKWRWPWRLALTQRIELVPAGPEAIAAPA